MLIYFALIVGTICALIDIDYTQSYQKEVCLPTTKQSPIDFSYYSPENLKFPAYPKFVLNNTFYTPINNKMFTYLESHNSNINSNPKTTDSYLYLGLNASGFGSAFFLYTNKTVTYDLNELRLHVFSEHTFEGHKMDLELQLVHTLNEEKTDPSLITQLDKYLSMSVLFSIARDKKSKFIDDIIGEDEDRTDERLRYTFTPVKSLDLNQFFNFHEPYYLYHGTGTTPFDCNVDMTWLVNKKVEYLSEKQMRGIQIAMMDFEITPNGVKYNHYPNGNSRKVNDNYSFEKAEYIDNTDRDGDDV